MNPLAFVFFAKKRGKKPSKGKREREGGGGGGGNKGAAGLTRPESMQEG